MKFHQMMYFNAVCKHKTISRAAEEMHISQPGVSSAIKELEDEFGIKLFRRQGNSLVLTEVGEEFLQSCNEILKKVEVLYEKMQNHGNNNILIKICVPPMIATVVFPKLWSDLAKKHSEIQLEIFEFGSVASRRQVAEGKTDLSFAIVDDLVDNTLEIEPVLKTELVYCVGKTHKYAKQSMLTWEMIAEENIVMMKEDSIQYHQLRDKFAQNNIVPRILLHSTQLATMKKFVYDGQVGAFFFKEVADQDDHLVGIPMEDAVTCEIALIWKRSTRQSDNIKRILKVAKLLFDK